VKDKTHVLHKPFHLVVTLRSQLFLDFVQPHGFLQIFRSLLKLMTKKPMAKLLSIYLLWIPAKPNRNNKVKTTELVL
jgi:hypothetical protein